MMISFSQSIWLNHEGIQLHDRQKSIRSKLVLRTWSGMRESTEPESLQRPYGISPIRPPSSVGQLPRCSRVAAPWGTQDLDFTTLSCTFGNGEFEHQPFMFYVPSLHRNARNAPSEDGIEGLMDRGLLPMFLGLPGFTRGFSCHKRPPLRFRWGRPFLPITPLQVTPSVGSGLLRPPISPVTHPQPTPAVFPADNGPTGCILSIAY